MRHLHGLQAGLPRHQRGEQLLEGDPAPAKARAYYAFPGVVLAFYAYYYLQAGTWAYYFDGSWTNQAGLIRTAFLPGHDAMTAGFFFLPAVPRAVAAAVTLAGGAAISLLTLSAVEPRLGAALRTHGVAIDAAGLRSTMFTIAAFIAFVSFYSFAGAPTLRLVPGLPHIFQLLVVATATLFLVRRIGRRQGAFTEETLARKIIANWKWDDIAPPRNLREAFLIHTVRSQSHEEGRKRLLDLYSSPYATACKAEWCPVSKCIGSNPCATRWASHPPTTNESWRNWPTKRAASRRPMRG